jgi:mono/diheme cytochrome c family protein
MRRISIALAALALAGCNTRRMPPIQVFPDMKQQPKYLPQAESRFFADGREFRRPVAGTVARGTLNQDAAAVNPLPVTRATLERGQERFNVYCAPCHDRLGSGQGIVALRSSWLAVNLSEPRVVQMPDAQLYDTITHGKRTMPGYRFQVNELDRWAIVTYVRALQRASSGTLADVPPELRSELR